MSHPTVPDPILARRRHPRGRVAAALACLALTACGSDAASSTTAPSDAPAVESGRPAFGLVSPEQAATLAADSGVTVLDVRTPEEFAEGHLDGAVLVDFSAPTFADEVAELDPSQPYLVYCRSGNRSGQAVAAMQSAGFGQLWDMAGGVTAWSSAGLPLVS